MNSYSPTSDDAKPDEESLAYLLPGKNKILAPNSSESADSKAAADLIRKKLDKIYADEPDAEAEIEEV